MAGASLSFEYETGPAVAFLRRLAEHIDDLSPVLGQMGEYLVDATRDRFDDQAAPDGTPWAPLSEGYARRKKKNADKILVLDGILRNTIAYNVGPHDLEVGTNRIYGATHQFGRDQIPARPFLGVSAEDDVELLELLREYVETAL